MLRAIDQLQPMNGLKDYATPETAATKATAVAERCRGLVTVRVVGTTPDKHGKTRYTALFFAFADETDMQFVAHQGFVVHR